MKVLKYALAAAGALVLVIAVLIAYFVITFDVRDHEPRIIALVKEKTGRTLVVRGETRLSFWPDLGVELGPVALTERDSDAIFAEIGNARLAAKLKPLFSKEIVADELQLQGASIRIVRDTDGRLNIDDLLSGEGGALDFDIARARVERSRVVYEDLASGARHEMADLALETGRLARGVPTSLRASFTARDGEQQYALATNVHGRLTIDGQRRVYSFDDAKLRVEGGVRGAGDLKATIDAGKIAASPGGVAAGPLSIDAKGGEWHARVKAPQVDWREGSIVAGDATFDVELKRDGRDVAANVAAALTASIAARAVELTNVRIKAVAKGDGLPKHGIEAVLTGVATVDAKAERAHLTLAGTVLDSRVKAQLTATGRSKPSYAFTLDVDSFDLDRYAASSGSTKSGGEGFDLATLSNVRAAGTVRVGVLKSSGVVAKNVQLAMKP